MAWRMVPPLAQAEVILSPAVVEQRLEKRPRAGNITVPNAIDRDVQFSLPFTRASRSSSAPIP